MGGYLESFVVTNGVAVSILAHQPLCPCKRDTGEGNGNPLWYSWLGNLTDRGAWRATGHGAEKSGTRLSD